MFNSILSLIDRIINLLDRRAKSRRDLFNEIVKPVFNEMEKVVEQYFLSLCRCQAMVEQANRDDLSPALDEIKALQGKVWVVLMKLDNLIEVSSDQIHNPSVNFFLKKVQNLLRSSDVHLKSVSKMSKKLNTSIGFWDYIQGDTLEKGVLLQYLSRCVDELEKAWAAVAQSYAHVQIKSLKG